jgi:hypothetical protein
VASIVATLLGVLAEVAPEKPSAAEEGRKVIYAMLIVGLVFIAVIALGPAGRARTKQPADDTPNDGAAQSRELLYVIFYM